MAGVRVHVVFPAGLLARVDAALGVGQSRGDWVRRAVEQALGDESRHATSPSPAPAEQPEMRGLEPIVKNALASGNAVEGVGQPAVDLLREGYRREFRPYPKGGK